MKFKKGELTQKSYNVIMHDLGCLDMDLTVDNRYHYDLLIGNLNDIFGIEKVTEE